MHNLVEPVFIEEVVEGVRVEAGPNRLPLLGAATTAKSEQRTLRALNYCLIDT